MEVEIWLYRALIIAVIGLAIWAAKKLAEKVDTLNTNVSKLNGILISQATNQKNIKDNCLRREKEVDKHFDKLDLKVEDHESRLQKLEP